MKDESITIETLERAIGTIQECIDQQHKLMNLECDPYIVEQHQELIDVLTDRKKAFQLTITSFDFLCRFNK